MERGKLWRTAFSGNVRLLEMNAARGAEQPLEQGLAFLHMHARDHPGQSGIIHKLRGLPGAI